MQSKKNENKKLRFHAVSTDKNADLVRIDCKNKKKGCYTWGLQKIYININKQTIV